MTDAECVAFLRWALPRLGMRWAGFRRVRRQVCRRVQRRLRELELPDPQAYRAHLEVHPEEWRALDALCRIPISRFFRDRGVFDALGERVLPELAEGARGALRCWSAGCASGEEPYSLTILWQLRLAPRFPALRLRVVATDADPHLLARARRGVYRASSLRELPAERIAAAFEPEAGAHRLRAPLREGVELRCQDIRRERPRGRFHLVLCRNLVFTYFEDSVQRELARALRERLLPGGALVIGAHEALPESATGLAPWIPERGIYRRARGSIASSPRPA